MVNFFWQFFSCYEPLLYSFIILDIIEGCFSEVFMTFFSLIDCKTCVAIHLGTPVECRHFEKQNSFSLWPSGWGAPLLLPPVKLRALRQRPFCSIAKDCVLKFYDFSLNVISGALRQYPRVDEYTKGNVMKNWVRNRKKLLSLIKKHRASFFL